MSPKDEQAQLEAILGTDPAPFETLISHLLSSSNKQRSQAENTFGLCRNSDPDSLFLKLGKLLLKSPHMEVRFISAVLLQTQLTLRESEYWSKLSFTTRSSLKSILLTCVKQEKAETVTKRLCYTISELASSIAPANGWPELLPFLYTSIMYGPPKLKRSALFIFSQLSQYTMKSLIPRMKILQFVFGYSLETFSPLDVRIAALSAVINFIQCVSSSDIQWFSPLLSDMMSTLIEALHGRHKATALQVLELLVELAGTKPIFFHPEYEIVEFRMLMIANAEKFDKETRHLAIEFLITFVEATGLMRNELDLLRILLQMLDFKNEPTWHTADNEDEDAGESYTYSFGQECLYRLAIALGGNKFVLVASEWLLMLTDSGWQKRHAVLIALAQIAQGCSEVMIKNLNQLVSLVLNSLQDPHPRVRWAAINAIRQLATYLGPDLQVQYHQRVLPALATAMDDDYNPRVQAHAASAVLNFSENCTQDILAPYLDEIVSKLRVLLQNGKQMVQEEALTVLASIADSSQEHFRKYYDAVMPYLKTILLNANDKANQMLCAKAMECISLVGMAVGKEKFREDAKQVMEVLMSLQGSQMQTDDPTTIYMLQAWARLCKCLGHDFLPYMGVVMPPLLLSAQLEPDVIITPADSDNDIDESDDESMETFTLGYTSVGIKTGVLEQKVIACYILCCYANELKEGFYPWIDQVARTLLPLLKFYFHKGLRKASVSVMPEFLRSAKLAIEKGLQGCNESYIKQLSDYIVPSLVEALHMEPDTDIRASMLDALNECIQVSEALLNENQVKSIVEEIKHVITASSSRKTEIAERAKAEDFHAEITGILRTLIKIFKPAFLPFFDEVSSFLMPMLGKDKTAEERRIAFCIFNDGAKQCRESSSSKYYDTYLPFLLEACNDENLDIQQAAIYGLGVCGEYGGTVIKPFAGEALRKLIAKPLLPDYVAANAVSAMYDICRFHCDGIVNQDIPGLSWPNLPMSEAAVDALTDKLHRLKIVSMHFSEMARLEKLAPPQHTCLLSCFCHTIESLVIRHRRILETPVDSIVTPAVRTGKAKISAHHHPKAKMNHRRKVKMNHRHKAKINHCPDSGLEYITLELQYEKKLVDDYLASQPELDAESRREVLDSLIHLHTQTEFADRSLHLMVSIIDRFLSAAAAAPILRSEFQLVGMTAMHIATKYEELNHIDVDDYIYVYQKCGYTCEEMLAMQYRILNKLGWNLHVSTVYTFLPHFIQVADCGLEETTMANLTYYYAELGVMEYEIATRYYPSMLAAAAVYAARASLKKRCLWPKKLEIHSGYKEMQLLECAERMVEVYIQVKEHKHSKEVRKKYARLSRDTVAELDVSLEVKEVMENRRSEELIASK